MALRHLPCSAYDFPAMEAWLEDMAERKGLFFDDFFGEGLASFTKGDPQKVTYRLEPADRKGPPAPEQLELFGAAGWEFVAAGWSGHIWVFRSFVEEPVPIHTDPATQAVALQRLQRQLRRKNYPLLALWAALGGVYLWTLFFGISARRYAIYGWDAFNMLYWLCLVAFWLAALTADLLPLKRLIRSLSAGVPMEHRGRYGWRRWMYYGLLAVALAYIVSVLTIGRQERPTETWELADSPQPYVSLKELGAEELSADGQAAWVDGVLADQWTIAQGEAKRVKFRADGRTWLTSRSQSELRLYETGVPGLPALLARDILRGEPDLLTAENVEDTGLEGAWYARGEGQQSLVLRGGRKVLWVRVDDSVPGDLRDHLAEYAALLED